MDQTFTRAETLSCKKCLEFIFLTLDGEATENEIKISEHHLQVCIKCSEAYKLEVEIRKALKSRILPQPLPLDLLSLIKNKITTPDTHP